MVAGFRLGEGALFLDERRVSKVFREAVDEIQLRLPVSTVPQREKQLDCDRFLDRPTCVVLLPKFKSAGPAFVAGGRAGGDDFRLESGKLLKGFPERRRAGGVVFRVRREYLVKRRLAGSH